MKPCFLLFTLLILPLVEDGMEPFSWHHLGSAHPDLSQGHYVFRVQPVATSYHQWVKVLAGLLVNLNP